MLLTTLEDIDKRLGGLVYFLGLRYQAHMQRDAVDHAEKPLYLEGFALFG